jgi:deazaflavin-dependent oxidoreductase (nitroreductase family)
VSDFNAGIIDEFRSNGGAVSRGFGTDLVLLHSTGARSGAQRIHPVLALRDGDAWLIAASKGGSPEHPAWFHNLVAHPDASVEAPDQRGGIDTVDVRAEALQGEARDAAWARFLEKSPAFGRYEETAGGRIIPVVKLSPR